MERRLPRNSNQVKSPKEKKVVLVQTLRMVGNPVQLNKLKAKKVLRLAANRDSSSLMESASSARKEAHGTESTVLER